jgi:hypothetical protein
VEHSEFTVGQDAENQETHFLLLPATVVTIRLSRPSNSQRMSGIERQPIMDRIAMAIA